MFAIPLVATIAWSYLSSWGGFILPLLSKIPWQVWAGIAGILGILYYGHIRENRGFEKCHVQVVAATQQENAHRQEAADGALKEAQSRASDSARRALELEDRNGELQKDVAALKTSGTICVPKSITDRLSKPRSVRNIR